MKSLPDIKALLALFEESTLPAMEIERDGVRVTLTRASADIGAGADAAGAVGDTSFASPRAASTNAGAADPQGAAENAPDASPHPAATAPANLAGTHAGDPVCGPTACDFGGHAVVSDRVGRVVTPADQLPAIGSQVTQGQPILRVEALKAVHEIVADGPGTIVAVHVASGDAVEWGQPLVTIQ